MKQTTIILKDNSKGVITDTDKYKSFRSKNYNFNFNKETGFFARWGETFNDDANIEKSLPEIIDLELSSSCHGVPSNGPCKFCYKSNTPNGEYMTFETFKKVFQKLPPTITQLAAGIGDIDANPDIWKIFQYCKDNGVIPNITINGARMTSEYYDNLSKYCGAVAVSVYDKELTYNTIKELTDRNMTQINIHYMISNETILKCYEVIDDMTTDKRLEKMNAIVFLSLKRKGNAKNTFTQLSQENFNKLCEYANSKKISYGFDSCSSRKFFNYIDNNQTFSEEYKKQMHQCIEPCESSCYSSYISCGSKDKGPQYFPCSFCESISGWEEGIDILSVNDFLKDVWYNEKTQNFKNKLISCNRNCPIYKI
jgi:MoaA/NifB/PqqE/SkfB family radical SAM enzyme